MTDPADVGLLPVTLANSRADRVRGVRSLTGRSVRRRAGRFLVEGPQGVREAIRFAAARVRDVYVAPGAVERYPEIVGEARTAGIPIHGCTDEVVDVMSKDAQGVVAVVDIASLSLDGVVRGRVSLVVILSNVRDPGNLGTIIRVADAAGADAVVLAGECADPHSPKVVRASTGSIFHLPVIEGTTLADAVSRAREVGLEVCAGTGSGTEDLFSLAQEGALAHPIAWVLGNEAWGLSDDEVALADRSVAIPIPGKAESLNVASAASVALYFCAYARQVHREGPG